MDTTSNRNDKRNSAGKYAAWHKCDACGKPVNPHAHMSDTDACGNSDGPGFHLCERKGCEKRIPADLDARRAYYAAQRERNRAT